MVACTPAAGFESMGCVAQPVLVFSDNIFPRDVMETDSAYWTRWSER